MNICRVRIENEILAQMSAGFVHIHVEQLPHEPERHIAATLDRVRDQMERFPQSMPMPKLDDPIVASPKMYAYQKPIYRCVHCGCLYQED